MSIISFDFSNTTTVVTGGSSGIGLACAEYIVSCGGNVIISESRCAFKTKRAIERLNNVSKNKSGSVLSYPCEVGIENSVCMFFDTIQKTGIQIDYLIHCAGVSPNQDFLEQTQQEWDNVLNVNTTGSFLVVKYGACIMKNNPLRGDFRGRIILISSTNGINSQHPISAHYDSSKSGVNILVRTSAEYLAEMKICVNGLAPGWINTELNNTVPQDMQKRETAKIWMERWGQSEEIAQCALHLLTMPYLMGQVIVVDGGYR